SRFYGTGISDAERKVLLREWGVAYVFSGPEEQGLGGFDPAAVDYLVPAYSNDVCAIYRVAMRDGQ
ncbi:MAG: hypothetical protein MUQ10_01200, partial [Anaerolineae bacterium]|nr:hypothetical protein [Anaerolineae bacterium]